VRIDIYHHVHDEANEDLLRKILGLVVKTHQRIGTMSENLDQVLEQVTNVEGKTDSLIALVEGLAQQIEDNIGDQAALAALVERLRANATKVQAAIDANDGDPNTPPAPPEEPTP